MFRHARILAFAITTLTSAHAAFDAPAPEQPTDFSTTVAQANADGPAPEQPLIPERVVVPRAEPSINLTDHLAQGTWAIGTVANCANARKRYVLTLTGNSVTWRDGTGNIDVEEIVTTGSIGFSTRTVKSDHGAAREVKHGTTWTYSKLSADTVQVQPSDKAPFTLVRCK